MKALLLMFSLLLTATFANAEEVTIKATLAEADLIWKGLRKLPVEEVEPLMQKLRQQVIEQTQPKPAKSNEQSNEQSKEGSGSGVGGSSGKN